MFFFCFRLKIGRLIFVSDVTEGTKKQCGAALHSNRNWRCVQRFSGISASSCTDDDTGVKTALKRAERSERTSSSVRSLISRKRGQGRRREGVCCARGFGMLSLSFCGVQETKTHGSYQCSTLARQGRCSGRRTSTSTVYTLLSLFSLNSSPGTDPPQTETNHLL